MLSYFVSLYIFAGVVGVAAQKVVRSYRLDIRYSALRLDNPWDYLFQGKGVPGAGQGPAAIEGVLVTAVCSIGEKNYLYVGILADYQLDKDENLDRLVLQGAYRRDLGKDRIKMDTPPLPTFDPENYYYIETDFLLLKYSEIKNLGVWYLVPSRAAGSSKGGGTSEV